MGKFDIGKMKIYDPDVQKVPFAAYMKELEKQKFNGFVFFKFYRDPVGNSGSNPTWGDLYEVIKGKEHYKGNCLYKEMDYDEPYASYCEKLWSILGKRVLGGKTRVPEITLVKPEGSSECGALSHIILNNDTEDMADMKKMLFFKLERQEQEKLKYLVDYQDLIDCVRIQVNNEENFKELEEQIVNTMLLDAVTNNADRHAKNWALVRNKATNHYSLGLYDHGVSFLDMVSDRPNATSTSNGRSMWTTTYIKTDPNVVYRGMGDTGDKIVKYLFNRYPEISEKFYETFCRELPGFEQDLKDAPSDINTKRIMSNLLIKKRVMEKIIDRQRGGGEEYYD